MSLSCSFNIKVENITDIIGKDTFKNLTQEECESVITQLMSSYNLTQEALLDNKYKSDIIAAIKRGREEASKAALANIETEMQQILENAPRDSEGKLLAPNGKKSNLTERQYAQVRTKAFKDWFGDWENNPKNASKVVDENGEPLVVYHGGSNTKVFNTKGGQFGAGIKKGDIGTYFTPSEKSARGYEEIYNYKIGEKWLTLKELADNGELSEEDIKSLDEVWENEKPNTRAFFLNIRNLNLLMPLIYRYFEYFLFFFPLKILLNQILYKGICDYCPGN